VNIEDSARLSFRLMGKADVQAFWELDQDPEVMRFITDGKPSSLETINEVFMPRLFAYRDAAKGWGIWQVTDKESQEYLGWVLVRPMDFFSNTPKSNDLELGWRFFKKTWGKGYATEAAVAIKDAFAKRNGIHFVSALALEGNIASINVMKKMGMTFIKKYLHNDPLGDFTAVHFQMAVK